MRANRWAKNGVLDRVFSALQERDIINIQVDHVSLDSTAVKVHPDGTGALKNTGGTHVIMDKPMKAMKHNSWSWPWRYCQCTSKAERAIV